MTIDLGVPTRKQPEWPVDVLRVDELVATGWEPFPFKCFVLKAHSRCNLACDYCYLYEMADESWRSSPMVMSPDVIEKAADRIGEHARAHDLDEVQVVLHGGEPLLAGAAVLSHIATAVRRAMPAGTVARFTVQTNGVLLTARILDVLKEHEIHVGVSVDGGADANDRHRRYADGRGSYEAVERGIALLRSPEYRHLYTGLLCTMDIDNDPIEVYRSLLSHEPPAMDFLLPHGNWSARPPRRVEDPSQTPYGDWLVTAFDEWYDAPVRETRVRLFEDVLSLLLGGSGTSEQIGLRPANVVVVNTDGSLEQVDTLKSTFDGAAATGLSVHATPFDAALRHPAVAARQIGVEGLSETCRSCSVRDVCGGGYYTHRYRSGSGFLNPSVYCPDLIRFITHVRTRLHADVERVRAGSGASA